MEENMIYEIADQLDISFGEAKRIFQRLIFVTAHASRKPQNQVKALFNLIFEKSSVDFGKIFAQVDRKDLDRIYQEIMDDRNTRALYRDLNSLIKICGLGR